MTHRGEDLAAAGHPRQPLDLKAIKARVEAATPGDWQCWNGWGPYRQDGLMRVLRLGPKPYDGGLFSNTGSRDIAGSREDFEFLAHASSDVRALLAEVERLREENARLNKSLAESGTLRQYVERR